MTGNTVAIQNILLHAFDECAAELRRRENRIYITCTAVCGIGGAPRTVVGSDDGFPSEQLLLLIDTPESSLRSPQAPILLHSLAILLQHFPLISHLSPSFTAA